MCKLKTFFVLVCACRVWVDPILFRICNAIFEYVISRYIKCFEKMGLWNSCFWFLSRVCKLGGGSTVPEIFKYTMRY